MAEQEKNEINIQELIGKVYYEIADWHNNIGDDPKENKTTLFGRSFKIINLVLSEVGLNLNEQPVENLPPDPEEDRIQKLENQLKMIAEKLFDQEQGKS